MQKRSHLQRHNKNRATGIIGNLKTIKALTFVFVLPVFILCGIRQFSYCQEWTIEKVVDTNTPIPGSNENFTRLNAPALHNGAIAFRQGTNGIYTFIDGVLSVVADEDTQVPGNSSPCTYANFRDPSIHGGKVVFQGNSLGCDDEIGIYTFFNGMLGVVADRSSSIPEGTETFNSFGTPSIESSTIGFNGRRLAGSATQQGVYVDAAGSLNAIADLTTPIPGGTGTFTGFGDLSGPAGTKPALSGINVAFYGQGSSGQKGIYTNIGGSINVVADLNTLIPDKAVPFALVGGFDLEMENIAFSGAGGIYLYSGGMLSVIVDNSMLIPDKTFTFNGFDFPSIDNGNVAWMTKGCPTCNYSGIFARMDGTLIKVVDNEDMIDGKTVSFFRYRRDGFSGNQIAFAVQFTDGSEGIFIADFDAGIANTPPVADAGADQTIIIGQTVQLDGSGSTDADGDPLTYNWTLQSIPAGSTTVLSDPTAVDPSFVPDVPGNYVVQLIVNDGLEDSAPDQVAITVQTLVEAAEGIVDEVEELIIMDILNAGQGNSLISKLERAIALLDNDQSAQAIRLLNAFINQVLSLVEEGILTEEEGTELIETATTIINLAGNELPLAGSGQEPASIIEIMNIEIPEPFFLGQNYPNPSGHYTLIPFNLQKQSKVSLKISDAYGREIYTLLEKTMPTGEYKIRMNTQHLNPGLYLYSLQGAGFLQTRRMMVKK